MTQFPNSFQAPSTLQYMSYLESPGSDWIAPLGLCFPHSSILCVMWRCISVTQERHRGDGCMLGSQTYKGAFLLPDKKSWWGKNSLLSTDYTTHWLYLLSRLLSALTSGLHSVDGEHSLFLLILSGRVHRQRHTPTATFVSARGWGMFRHISAVDVVHSVTHTDMKRGCH